MHPDGKFVVDLDKSIDMSQVTPNLRVALRNDSYTLHKILPSKIDPLVSLMMVEKVPDSTYDMVGGLDKQIKEIKEVSFIWVVLFKSAARLSHVRTYNGTLEPGLHKYLKLNYSCTHCHAMLYTEQAVSGPSPARCPRKINYRTLR